MDLSLIRNTLYDKAELLWLISFFVSFVAQLISFFAAVFKDSILLDVVAFATAATPIVVNWLRGAAGEYSKLADQCRRRILYSEAYSRPIPAEELALLQSSLLGMSLHKITYQGPYFASVISPGSQRLADMVAESAYFTYCLADKIIKILRWILAASIVVIVIVVYFSFFSSVNPSKETISAVKSVVSIVSVLVASDLFFLYNKYQALKSGAQDSFKICAELRKQADVSSEKVHQSVEDYNSLLVQSPPILSFVHKLYQAVVNEAYKNSHTQGVK